ncbi:sensor histidine kinase [Flavihumibacter petaseus]|uniref:Putative two-component histidine kinase n=1 Tax=Flavihumibacter petaseus NBRC 106054 TaxID=1220578 RepID=A0A0E9N4K9_9BACT|nr:histidine kinase [Flavihumibacter petaseus]GAO44606.1 putative two-component histidine kinase [Flavihumibacter petaseus NBRC 106054]
MMERMALMKYSKKEAIIGFLLLPPIAVVVNFLLFGKRYTESLGGFLLATLISLATIFLVYISCGMIAAMLIHKYPLYSQTFKRICIGLLLYITVMVAGISLLFWGYDYVSFLGYSINMEHYSWALLVGITANLLATSFNEGAAFYEKWRSLVDEAEQLKKENLQSQLEGLKGQVNPHFLFNSLNSLSSLISEDPAKAEKFLDEMSKVYRYMLRTNEDGLTTLDTELQFIQSYFHLLKTRYGDGLEMEVRIEDRLMVYLLPPLTLQMLVENAVKHNMILRDSPLKIELITTNSNRLIVSNNLQRKDRMVYSTRVGLNNIRNKYRLMKGEEIMIRDDGKEFAVVIPLIQP